MKSNFSEQLRALRKERHLTQEQLAEAMGVSPGAVYKWEQAISTPDIEVIMELASFFEISLDAMVGYRVCSSDRKRILQELKRIKLEKAYAACWDEVEKWIHRYPNDFEIVYHSGVLYHLAGIETGDNAKISRSIDLLSHACTLIRQNRDPKLSETEIHRDIAIGYLVMGQWDKGMEQLQKNNPCGVYDDIIGQELATNPQMRTQAVPYLTNALLHCTASLYRIVVGFVNLFFAREDYRSVCEILKWMTGYLESLKTDRGVSYLDKNNATLLALWGAVCKRVGDLEQGKQCLRKARRIALEFDKAPNYTNQNIRYCEQADLRASYDNIGSTAMDSILNILQEGVDGPDQSVLDLWEEICHEA